MKRASVQVFALGLVTLACKPASAALDIGDRAPALVIAEWVKGERLDLQREIGKKIYMVEFWATWCPPCKASVPRLTEFQRKYKKDLTIIGVTAPDDRGNTPKAVRRFVKRLGSGMEYTVAIDKDMATTNAYLSAAGIVGIPHAFIVGRDGRVLWQGSPLDPSLDDVLGQVVSGTYDVSHAKVQAEVERRFQALEFPAQMGRFSEVWDGLIGILKLDPTNSAALDILTQVYVNEIRDQEAFRTWAGSHIAKNRGNMLAMQRLAAALCANGDLSTRTPDLALEAAKAAYEASNERNATSIAIYARALYQIGDLDRAVALQKDAAALGDEADRKMLREILEYYSLCKSLRDGAS